MTYYDILEISEKASPEVIRMAYKALCKKYHPDVYQGDKNFAEEKMKQINEAFNVLSDEIKRRQYDFTLNRQASPKQTNSAANQSYSQPKRESKPYNFLIMLALGFNALEDGNWELADGAFDKILSSGLNIAEAYLGKLMVELHVRKRENLKNCDQPFDNKVNYKKAYAYGDNALKEFLQETIKFINKRNHDKTCLDIYNRACGLMRQNNIKCFEDAIAEFEKIRDYKDSKKQIEYCHQKIAEIKSAILAAEAERERQKAARKEAFIQKIPLIKKVAVFVVPLLILLVVIITVFLKNYQSSEIETYDTSSEVSTNKVTENTENVSDVSSIETESTVESSDIMSSAMVSNELPTTNQIQNNSSLTNINKGSKEINNSSKMTYSDGSYVVEDYNSAAQIIYRTTYDSKGNKSTVVDYNFDASGEFYIGFVEQQFYESGQLSLNRKVEFVPNSKNSVGVATRSYKEYYSEYGEITKILDIEYEFLQDEYRSCSLAKTVMVYYDEHKILAEKYVYQNSLNNGNLSIIETHYTYDLMNGTGSVSEVVRDMGGIGAGW